MPSGETFRYLEEKSKKAQLILTAHIIPRAKDGHAYIVMEQTTPTYEDIIYKPFITNCHFYALIREKHDYCIVICWCRFQFIRPLNPVYLNRNAYV